MAASPGWKVYNAEGEYVAACKHLEDAAAIVNNYGNGATIRAGHRAQDTVWHEGHEAFPAGESFDGVRDVCVERAKSYGFRRDT